MIRRGLFLASAFMICASAALALPSEESMIEEMEEAFYHGDDAELLSAPYPFACKKATAAQKKIVNSGNSKKTKFLNGCKAATADSSWCSQLIRPNPESKDVFACTYGSGQTHQLIHPDESTWKHAYEAVKIVKELHNKGISVCLIYNWWRPEPYNANVGGAPGRHPYGTSVDVRFCSPEAKERAFLELCRMRKAGRVNAVGYYSTSALHFGVGDKQENTWGKACP